MFENLIGQSAVVALKNDIASGFLPHSMLFAGAAYSGKFTAAIEVARILSCEKKGEWGCACNSCVQHRFLSSQELLVTGYRSCLPEIRASAEVFLRFFNEFSSKNGEESEKSANFSRCCTLFSRSVRKLLVRFSPAILEGSDKIGKISPLISDLNEFLEGIDLQNAEILSAKFPKRIDGIVEAAQKLEYGFLSESISVAAIRNISAWAQFTSERKKTVILENADTMNGSAGNALLKTLEEPCENCHFVLLTKNRRRLMPTILSRTRTYDFAERTREAQQTVISRVFHLDDVSFQTLSEFFEAHQNLPSEEIKSQAHAFLDFAFRRGERPGAEKICAALQKFEPKIVFEKYLCEILNCARGIDIQSLPPEKKPLFFALGKTLTDCLRQTSVFNRSPQNVLEKLLDDVS